MPPIDQHGEFYRSRTTEIREGIQRSSHGATSEEDIVNQQDNPTFDVNGNLRRRFGHHGTQVEVVTVEGDIKRTFGDRRTGDASKFEGESIREGHPAALEADDDQSVEGSMAFDDFVRHSGEGSADTVSAQDFADSCR
jgi:hypothetical protein